ncbi:metallophosphoesterase [Tautonia plasticadhaerens]|uniref:Calcineurin-like phosphoesterase n=1 Tax=Tautonia plasticadhaerens TaxID=2527974 RepID=A0A518GWN7_9BACT|nr:metallophosphoesterase [Tautonia plasticadhaerens]QDV33008.1 Calcineurin-like phosphoesterase [Tautonia plasticadhaerens]
MAAGPGEDGMIDGPPGWRLAPEGAAVFESDGGRVAVVADVHLGYEWARAAGGDVVPSHSLGETLAKLDRLLGRVAVDRLVVAGDLTESASPCPRSARDAERLRRRLADRGVELVLIAGNHDPRRLPALPESIRLGGWTVSHGHRPIRADRAVFGHHHPALRAGGVTAPCFLVDDRTIALPAFSPNAAGLDVGTAALPPALRRASLRCFAGSGRELLDFGPLGPLRAALAGRGA